MKIRQLFIPFLLSSLLISCGGGGGGGSSIDTNPAPDPVPDPDPDPIPDPDPVPDPDPDPVPDPDPDPVPDPDPEPEDREEKSALLMPAEGGEGLVFNDGASWFYFNKAASLVWKNEGGDYVDANGVAQGPTPWAVQTIEDTDSIKDVTWDVTGLVSAWAQDVYGNNGFHIRYVSGSSNPIIYASGEASDSINHPSLEVLTQDSGSFSFSPIGDTYLVASTKTVTFGQDPTIRVRGDNNSLVWFDLSSLQGETIVSAELQLTTLQQYTNTDAVHGIFATSTSNWDTSSPVLGIADAYPNDAGIIDHPDVYLSYTLNTNSASDGGEDFLNDTVDTIHAENYWPCDTLAPIGRQADGNLSIPAIGIPGYIPLDGNALCLRVKYEDGPPRTQGLGNYGAGVKKTVSSFSSSEQTDELFVRVYLFLGDTWGENLNDQDGKRPGGISGTQVNTPYQAGWGGRTSDGSNGWSARGGYKEIVPDGFNPLAGYTAMANYIYHADQLGGYGDNLAWNLSPNSLLERGRWYSIEQQVKMNTRDGANIQGSSGANDGIVRAWVDGRLVFERTDLRFTDMDFINIDTADFSLYYGGAENTPYDQHIAIDNIVISKSYIGPMNKQ